jgi:hypothetical protein
MWIPPALIPARFARDAWTRHLAARVACSAGTAAVLLGAPGLVAAAAGWADAHCLMWTLAGCPCPGCGVTTSLIALGAGDLRQALRSNPAGIAVAAALAAQAILAAHGMRRGGHEPAGRAWLGRLDRLVVGALAAAWMARLWGGW